MNRDSNNVKQEKAKEGEKNPPTPGFELKVTQCLVGATLSSPPGGMEIFQVLHLHCVNHYGLRKVLTYTPMQQL